MTASRETQDGTVRPFTGWHMLAIMVAFFGVVIAVNVTMAWFASASWTGLVVPNSYVASQQFNTQLAAARAQKARGWRSEIGYGDGALKLRVVDAYGRAVLFDRLVAVAGRPAEDRADRRVEFTYSGNGLWTVENSLDHGVWQIRVDGEISGEPFRLDARLVISSEGEGRLE